MKSEDVDVVKHSGVEAFFGERFAKTAHLDPRFHRMLIRARKTREMADYVLGERISAATASQKLRDAKEFVAAADRFLGRTSEAHGDGPAKG